MDYIRTLKSKLSRNEDTKDLWKEVKIRAKEQGMKADEVLIEMLGSWLQSPESPSNDSLRGFQLPRQHETPNLNAIPRGLENTPIKPTPQPPIQQPQTPPTNGKVNNIIQIMAVAPALLTAMPKIVETWKAIRGSQGNQLKQSIDSIKEIMNLAMEMNPPEGDEPTGSPVEQMIEGALANPETLKAIFSKLGETKKPPTQ